MWISEHARIFDLSDEMWNSRIVLVGFHTAWPYVSKGRFPAAGGVAPGMGPASAPLLVVHHEWLSFKPALEFILRSGRCGCEGEAREFLEKLPTKLSANGELLWEVEVGRSLVSTRACP